MVKIAPPPIELMFDGPQTLEAYLANGEEFLAIFRDKGGLKLDDKILDVGSGTGRKTIPLTDYLTDKAKYYGIDVKKEGVDWCTENITAVCPNFTFQHIDVYSPGYNPTGTIAPSTFKFPFEDNTFDFVTLCSVFTHMQWDDLTNYLHEVYRVMKPGGRCLITYFLIVKNSPWDDSTIYYDVKNGKTASKEFPEQAIAFCAQPLMELYQETGFIIEQMHWGTWNYRWPGLSYQDIIIAIKGP